jgi:hypothetical protein
MLGREHARQLWRHYSRLVGPFAVSLPLPFMHLLIFMPPSYLDDDETRAPHDRFLTRQAAQWLLLALHRTVL